MYAVIRTLNNKSTIFEYREQKAIADLVARSYEDTQVGVFWAKDIEDLRERIT